MEASIELNGAILIGNSITCDAHFPRPIRVVTHAHLDHICGIEKSIAECNHVLMTYATRDLIEIIKPKKCSNKIKCIEYGTTFIYEGEKITLYSANHIIGSAQVLVEAEKRILYTGDFRIKGIQIIPTDILIIEATYGNQYRRRKFKYEVEYKLIDLIKNAVTSSNVYIFGYHGKLQEVHELIHKAGLASPIVMPDKTFKMMKVCEKYGMQFGKYYTIHEAQKLDHFIALYHMGAKQWTGKGATKIVLSGWEFKYPVKQEKENEFRVALSNHADFDDLIQYVEISRPKLVITDNKRGGDAVSLAKEITKKFGIPAKPMP